MDKITLTFSQITERILATRFPAVDAVVGIANGGTVPACLVAFHLNRPLELLQVSYRDPQNQPQFPNPQLLDTPSGSYSGKHILLVDDVSVSGKTLAFAREQLHARQVTTFVLKGTADLVAFPEIAACVHWPWHASSKGTES